MATAYHLVHYRRFSSGSTDLHGNTFEQLCRTALDKTDGSNARLWERVNDRLFELGDSEGRQILLNKVADLSSAVFGEMCLTQSTDLQALLSLTPSVVQLSNITMAEIFDLGERRAPTGSKFVRGLIYWLAIGDHLFFVKTQSMTSELLQSYFDWLLKKAGDAIAASVPILFRAELDRSQVAGDVGDIRALRLSGKAAPHLSIDPDSTVEKPKEVETSRTVLGKFVEYTQALPVVEALFGKRQAESLVASLGRDEYLAVDASVKVRGKRTARSRAKLYDIVNDLADITDGKVQVEGKDGVLSGGDAILRTRMPFNLPIEGSSLLEFDNVSDQLQVVYNRYVEDGKITA